MIDKKSKGRRKRQIITVARNCPFCKEGTTPDFKSPENLSRYLSERGKILPASRTGLCPKHQRRLATAVKRSRYIALLPFVVGVK